MPTPRFARYLSIAPAISLILLGVLIWDHFSNAGALFPPLVALLIVQVLAHMGLALTAGLSTSADVSTPPAHGSDLPIARPYVERNAPARPGNATGSPRPPAFITQDAPAVPLFTRPNATVAGARLAAAEAAEAPIVKATDDAVWAQGAPREVVPCAALTASQEPCRNNGRPDSPFCAIHKDSPLPIPADLESWGGHGIDAGSAVGSASKAQSTAGAVEPAPAKVGVPKATVKAHKRPSKAPAKVAAPAPPKPIKAHKKSTADKAAAPAKQQCLATTASDKQCSNGAQQSSDFCGIHRQQNAVSSGASGRGPFKRRSKKV